jgi:hypothetical protein
MDQRERITTALRGGMPDRVPWTIYSLPNFLPEGAVERRLRNHGLGLHIWKPVCSVKRRDVRLIEYSVDESDETIKVRTFQTPLGELTERRRPESAYNSSWIIEHFIKEPRDYEILEFIIRDTHFGPDYSPFLRTTREMGTDGIVTTNIPRLPFQRLWIEYTGLERLLFDLQDHPEPVGRVLGAMEEKDREMWEVVAASPAEFIWAADNVSAAAISPRLFDQHFVPHYEALADFMHRHGKLIYSHIDGTTRPIVDRIARLPIDIIEAFTPKPTGDLSLAEARAAWKGKVLWINFPSSVLVEPPEEVARVTKHLLRQAAPGDGFLLAITENIPEFALERSLEAITETVERFGACPLSG